MKVNYYNAVMLVQEGRKEDRITCRQSKEIHGVS